MPSRRAERLAGWLAVLCLAVLALLAGQPYFTNASKPPRGIASPIVAIEMVRSVQEADYILGDSPSLDREVMRMKQYIGFARIASLTALFVVLGWMLMREGGFGRLTGPAAIICAIGAAIFGVLDKLAVLRLLDVTLAETTPPMLHAIHSTSVAMWSLTGFTLALLCGLFLRAEDWMRRTTGALLLITAICELYGLRDNRFLLWQEYPAVAGLLLIAARLVLRRRRVRSMPV